MRVIMIPRAIEQDAGERYVGTVSRVKSDSTWCKLNELLSNYQYPSHYLHRRSKILIKLKSRWTSRIWKLWAGYPGVYFTKTTYFWLFSFFVYVLVRSVFHVTMWNVVLFLIIFFSTVGRWKDLSIALWFNLHHTWGPSWKTAWETLVVRRARWLFRNHTGISFILRLAEFSLMLHCMYFKYNWIECYFLIEYIHYGYMTQRLYDVWCIHIIRPLKIRILPYVRNESYFADFKSFISHQFARGKIWRK